MTPADLRKLINAATPGPWTVSDDPDDKKAVIDDLSLIALPPGASSWDADGPFIATARNTLPALLDLWEAVRLAETEREGPATTREQAVTNALAALKDLKP